MESSDDAIIGKTLDGIIESWNYGAEQFVWLLLRRDGWPAYFDSHSRRSKGKFARYFAALAQWGIDRGIQDIREHKNGLAIPVALKISPIFDRTGTIVGASAIARDITNLKNVEEELRQTGERFQLAVRATRDIVCDWDILNDRVWFSERFFEIFGYDPATFPTGVNGWADLVHPEDTPVIPFDGATYSTSEYRLRRADGTWAYVHA